MHNNQSQSRIIWLDFARSFAILCVLLCHSFETVYGPIITGNFVYAVFHAVGRLGVPVFLFISGVLILQKSFRNADDVIKFYKRNLLPLVITAEIWMVLYIAFIFITGEYLPSEGITPVNVALWLTFIKAFPMSHWWYIPTIIGIYVALPLVALAVQRINKPHVLLIPLGITFVYRFLFPSLNYLFDALGLPFSVRGQLDTTWLGGAFGLYVLIGYLVVRTNVLKFVSPTLLACVFFFSLMTSATAEYYGLRSWYDTPWTLFASISCFEMLSRADTHNRLERISSHLELVSKTSFGIYLLHKPLIQTISKLLSWIPIPVLHALAIVPVLAILCILIVELFSPIPALKRALFHA